MEISLWVRYTRMVALAGLLTSTFVFIICGLTTPGDGLTEEMILKPFGWSIAGIALFGLLTWTGDRLEREARGWPQRKRLR